MKHTLRLAWLHIHKYGLNKAIENICFQLQTFVGSVGAQNKYNKTVTIAAIKTVYHFMLKSTTNNFYDFILENPKLNHNFRELLSCHYKVETFTSEWAKKEYVAPDLLPFD